jgi:hypothetical protein
LSGLGAAGVRGTIYVPLREVGQDPGGDAVETGRVLSGEVTWASGKAGTCCPGLEAFSHAVGAGMDVIDEVEAGCLIRHRDGALVDERPPADLRS